MTTKITWHKGSGRDSDDEYGPEAGAWHARLGGKVVARAQVNPEVPTGYYRRYSLNVYVPGEPRPRKDYPSTLRECKQITAAAFRAPEASRDE